jgi:hypothetical protein
MVGTKGVFVSYGDNLAVVFDEITLNPVTGGEITLPEVPVKMIADIDGKVVVGNADSANSAGTFTEVNLTSLTATLIPSESVSGLPTGMVPAVTADGTGPAGTGVNFYDCLTTGGGSCQAFTTP